MSRNLKWFYKFPHISTQTSAHTNKHTNTSNYAQRICTKYILMNQHMIIFAVSTFTKGEQMVPVLNKLGVHCAVYGNHDFGR